MDKKFLLGFLLVLVIGIAIRALTVRFYPLLMEPDMYSYYSVASQTMANHLRITSNLSGVPSLPYNESPVLIYLAILFSWITGSLANAYVVLPLLFAGIEMLLIYLTTLEITGDKWPALCSMFIFAIMVAAIFKNSALEFRGESFVPAIVLGAIYILIKSMKAETKIKQGIYEALSVVLVGLAFISWTGGIYVFAIGALMMLFLILMVFFKTKRELKTIATGTAIAMIAGIIFFYLGPYYTIKGGLAILELQPPNFDAFLGAFGLAIPLSILGIVLMAKRLLAEENPKKRVIFYSVYSLYVITFLLEFMAIRNEALLALPMAILAGPGLWYLWTRSKAMGKGTAYYLMALIVVGLAVAVAVQVPFYSPLNTINASTSNALIWMKNNTPINSTVLTFWTDGSVVEGVAQRRVFTASMIAGNPIQIANFNRWLYANAGNETYINQTKPNYIFARSIWLYETAAIKEEANISQNKSINGTNMQELLNGSAPFQKVYAQSGSIIYRVD